MTADVAFQALMSSFPGATVALDHALGQLLQEKEDC